METPTIETAAMETPVMETPAMEIKIVPIREEYRDACLAIFNQIIEEGETFPFDVPFSRAEFDEKYIPSEPVWCAVSGDKILGFVHIHPNGLGRCAHIANCGYSVRKDYRGKGIGRMLVAKSIEVAREMGFKGMQFNAVVSTNKAAIALYRSFGFEVIGTVPCGFRLNGMANEDANHKDSSKYVDMHIMYLSLL